METKYPNIEVQLSDQDGNAFVIIGRVKKAMVKAGVSPEEVSEFEREAKSGDYDNVLQTCMKWVDVS